MTDDPAARRDVSETVEQQIVHAKGMCGDLSPDGTRICIRDPHDDDHRWDDEMSDLSGATKVAREFHRHYERLAPRFSYKTREASAVPWEDVPQANRDLMVAVVETLVGEGVISIGPSGWGSGVREALMTRLKSVKQLRQGQRFMWAGYIVTFVRAVDHTTSKRTGRSRRWLIVDTPHGRAKLSYHDDEKVQVVDD